MNVEVTTRGSVDPELAKEIADRIRDLGAAVDRDPIDARVVLMQEENPRIAQAARAEGDVRFNGYTIRGRVAAETMDQAVNDLVERLREQLRRHVDRLNTKQRTPPTVGEGEWRSGAWTPPRPPRSWRPPGERQVIRRKSFALEPMDAIDAAGDMAALDHEFYLFKDSDTGADSLIYRRDDGHLAVIAPQDAPEAPEDGGPTRERSRYSEPLSLADAISEMDELNHRFLFFVNAETGRGNVLYLRYDGHYGLIEPAS